MSNKNSPKSDNFRHSKLYRVYENLNEKQKNRFRDFIESPYHNSKEKLITYWEVFERYGRSKKKLTLLGFFHKLPSDHFHLSKSSSLTEAEKIVKIRKRNTEIYHLLQSFLGQEIYQAQPLLQQLYTYQGISRLNLKGGFKEWNPDTTETQLEWSSLSPYRLFLQHQFWAHQLSIQQENHNHSQAETITETIHQLDEFYLTQRILYEVERAAFEKRSGKKLKARSLKNILEAFGESASNSLAKGYLYLYQAHKSPKELIHFEHLRKLLEEEGDTWEATSRRNLATGAINLLTLRSRENSQIYKTALLENYYEFLMEGWICIDGKLEVRHFNNLITLLLKDQEIEQAKEVYNKWGFNLLSNSSEQARRFNFGKILLEEGKNDEAESQFSLLFQNITSENDFLYDFYVRLLLLRIYFSEDDPSAFDNPLAGFKSHIQNHPKASSAHIFSALNCIRFMEKLLNYKSELHISHGQFNEVRDEINKEPKLSMKLWLLKEVDELNRK